MDLDVYGILGVLQSASAQEIRKAYRKKALKCHPDKNPDNPSAAKLFHDLSKALELLLDESARAAYDRVLNAKTAAKLRTQELDSRRKKLKEDLETREKEANLRASGYKAYDLKTDEEKLQAEIKRLQEEGSKELAEEKEYVRRQVEIETANRAAEDLINPCRYRLKINWRADKSDPENGGYDYEKLMKIFSKHGEISVLVLSAKKKGSALLEFSNANSAIKAEQFEKGIPSNPLKVSFIKENLPPQSKKSSNFTSSDNISFEKFSMDSSSGLFPSMSETSNQRVSFEAPTSASSIFPSMSGSSDQKLSSKKSSSGAPSLFPSVSNNSNQRLFPLFPSQPNRTFKMKDEEKDSSDTLVPDSDYETQVLRQLHEAAKRKKSTETAAKDDASSHQTQSVQLKACISDSIKNQILVSIGNTVINFRDTLVSLGYSLAQKAHNNQEAAKNLCGAAEVVYDGFKGDNETMTKYQNETLHYSDTSLMITIFNNLIRGVHVLEDEENPDNLDSVAIWGEICHTYDGHDIWSYLCHD